MLAVTLVLKLSCTYRDVKLHVRPLGLSNVKMQDIFFWGGGALLGLCCLFLQNSALNLMCGRQARGGGALAGRLKQLVSGL